MMYMVYEDMTLVAEDDLLNRVMLLKKGYGKVDRWGQDFCNIVKIIEN